MVPELEQRGARPARSAGRNFLTKHAFPDKSDQPGAVPKPGFASIRVKETANQVPTPNESIFEEHGSRVVRKRCHLGGSHGAMVWVSQRRGENLEIRPYMVTGILHGGVEALFAKVAKTL